MTLQIQNLDNVRGKADCDEHGGQRQEAEGSALGQGQAQEFEQEDDQGLLVEFR